MNKKLSVFSALLLAGSAHVTAEQFAFDLSAPPQLVEGVSSNQGSALLGETFIYETTDLQVRILSRGTTSGDRRNFATFTDTLGIGVYSQHNDIWHNETPYLENFADSSSNNITLDFSHPVRLDSISLGYIGSDSDLQVRYSVEAGIGRTDVTNNLPLGESYVNLQGVYATRWIIDPVPLNWNTGGLYPTTDGLVESVLISGISGDADITAPPPSGDAPELNELSYVIPENNYPAAYLDWADPNGDNVSAEIAGGADAASFVYYADDQKLVYLSAPDFEYPHDANGDNFYEVIMSATDGVNTATFPISIEVTGVNEAPELSCCLNWMLGLGDSVVGEFVAVDQENDPIEMSLFGNFHHQNLFQLSDEGVLSMKNPSTTEETYYLNIRISDGTPGNTVINPITVQVIKE